MMGSFPLACGVLFVLMPTVHGACGPPCNSDQWCQLNAGNGFSANTCRALGDAGDTCGATGSRSCKSAFRCHAGTCQTLGNLNEECGGLRPGCAGRLYCDILNIATPDVCRAYNTVPNGHNCSSDSHCTSPPLRNSPNGNNYCNLAVGQCAPRLPVGATCANHNDCAGACNYRECHTFCDASTNLCTARAGLGAPCAQGPDSRCKHYGRTGTVGAPERYCFSATSSDATDTCRDRSAFGGPCVYSQHCEDGLSCPSSVSGTGVGKTCTSPPPPAPPPPPRPPPPPPPPSCSATQPAGGNCTGAGGSGVCNCAGVNAMVNSNSENDVDGPALGNYVFCRSLNGAGIATSTCSGEIPAGGTGCRRGSWQETQYTRGYSTLKDSVKPTNYPNRHCSQTTPTICIDAADTSWTHFSGKCVSMKTIGDSCEAPDGSTPAFLDNNYVYHTQCPGGYCSSLTGKCTAKLAVGANCSEDYECGYDLNNNVLMSAGARATSYLACIGTSSGAQRTCQQGCASTNYATTVQLPRLPLTGSVYREAIEPVPFTPPVGCAAGESCMPDAISRGQGPWSPLAQNIFTGIGMCKARPRLGEPCSIGGPYCLNELNDNWEKYAADGATVNYTACIKQSDNSRVCVQVKKLGEVCEGAPRAAVVGEGTWNTLGQPTNPRARAIGTYQIQCPLGNCDNSSGTPTCTSVSTCQYDYECGAFKRCVGATAGNSDGTCQKFCMMHWWKHSNGMSYVCSSTEYCDATSCQPKKSVGGRCANNDQCMGQGFCFENKCVEAYALGMDCQAKYQCAGYEERMFKSGYGRSYRGLRGDETFVEAEPETATVSCWDTTYGIFNTDEAPSDTMHAQQVQDDNGKQGTCATQCSKAKWICTILNQLEGIGGKIVAGILLLVIFALCGVCCLVCCAMICMKPKHGDELGIYIFQPNLKGIVSTGSMFAAPPTKPCCGAHKPRGQQFEEVHIQVEAMLSAAKIDPIVDQCKKLGLCVKRVDLADLKKKLEETWLAEVNTIMADHGIDAQLKPKGDRFLVLHVYEKLADNATGAGATHKPTTGHAAEPAPTPPGAVDSSNP
jgi:hypothetical protein